MSAIKDVYDIIKELLELTKAAENHEMATKVVQIQDKYFEIKEEIEAIKDENRTLKETIARMSKTEELEKDLELTEKGYIIRKSEKERGENKWYCPACWQKEHLLMILVSPSGYRYRCCNCGAYIANSN